MCASWARTSTVDIDTFPYKAITPAITARYAHGSVIKATAPRPYDCKRSRKGACRLRQLYSQR
jgi:hypothetical protein